MIQQLYFHSVNYVRHELPTRLGILNSLKSYLAYPDTWAHLYDSVNQTIDSNLPSGTSDDRMRALVNMELRELDALPLLSEFQVLVENRFRYIGGHIFSDIGEHPISNYQVRTAIEDFWNSWDFFTTSITPDPMYLIETDPELFFRKKDLFYRVLKVVGGRSIQESFCQEIKVIYRYAAVAGSISRLNMMVDFSARYIAGRFGLIGGGAVCIMPAYPSAISAYKSFEIPVNPMETFVAGFLGVMNSGFSIRQWLWLDPKDFYSCFEKMPAELVYELFKDSFFWDLKNYITGESEIEIFKDEPDDDDDDDDEPTLRATAEIHPNRLEDLCNFAKSRRSEAQTSQLTRAFLDVLIDYAQIAKDEECSIVFLIDLPLGNEYEQ